MFSHLAMFFFVLARTEMKISWLLKYFFLTFFLVAFLCLIITVNIWQKVCEGSALFSI